MARIKCIIKRALIVYPIAVLLDDVISNIIRTNVRGINVKLIHFSIAGLIVTSLTLSDLGKLAAQSLLTIDKTWANTVRLKFPVSNNCSF